MNEDNKIWFEHLQFKQAVESLERVADQLCKARDDTYHRARAEAANEAHEKTLRMIVREVLEVLRDRS